MKRIYTLFASIILCALFLTITNHYKAKNLTNSPKSEKYVLIAEDDLVNLYYGEILLKTYDTIVPDSLPPTDRDNIKSGIILDDYNEVMSIIEDFDG